MEKRCLPGAFWASPVFADGIVATRDSLRSFDEFIAALLDQVASGQDQISKTVLGGQFLLGWFRELKWFYFPCNTTSIIWRVQEWYREQKHVKRTNNECTTTNYN
jgi:hypothetical protein